MSNGSVASSINILVLVWYSGANQDACMGYVWVAMAAHRVTAVHSSAHCEHVRCLKGLHATLFCSSSYARSSAIASAFYVPAVDLARKLKLVFVH